MGRVQPCWAALEAAFKECFGCEALEELFSFQIASQGAVPVAIVSPLNIEIFTAAGNAHLEFILLFFPHFPFVTCFLLS